VLEMKKQAYELESRGERLEKEKRVGVVIGIVVIVQWVSLCQVFSFANEGYPG
jgi:hypothetical protein